MTVSEFRSYVATFTDNKGNTILQRIIRCKADDVQAMRANAYKVYHDSFKPVFRKHIGSVITLEVFKEKTKEVYFTDRIHIAPWQVMLKGFFESASGLTSKPIVFKKINGQSEEECLQVLDEFLQKFEGRDGVICYYVSLNRATGEQTETYLKRKEA